jgi:hypothetical protein
MEKVQKHDFKLKTRTEAMFKEVLHLDLTSTPVNKRPTRRSNIVHGLMTTKNCHRTLIRTISTAYFEIFPSSANTAGTTFAVCAGSGKIKQFSPFLNLSP